MWENIKDLFDGLGELLWVISAVVISIFCIIIFCVGLITSAMFVVQQLGLGA